ncbi:MAG: GLPGLI family protein [Candidatus Egerieousia sp.]
MKIIRFLLLISLAVFTNTNVSAQIPQPAFLRDFSKRATIDTSTLSVTYKCRIRVVLHMESYTSDIQVLEAGMQYSRYYSKNAELLDSLNMHGRVLSLGRDSVGRKEGIYEDLYFNRPKKGMLSVYTRFMDKNFVYTEDIPKQSWTFTDEEETILGYKCQKAYADFRGRRWYAWFATDIPLSYGPWKLRGLPGLILKAEDAERYFTFEAVGLSADRHPIMMFTERSQKCEHEDVWKLNELRWQDSDFLIKMMTGKEVVNVKMNDYGEAVIDNSRPKVIILQKEKEL